MWNRVKTKASKWIYRDSQINYFIAGLTILIGLFGIFTILSASSNLTIKYNTSQTYYAIRQGLYFLIGIIAMALVSSIDYRLYKKYYKQIFLISIILLLLALFSPFRVLYNGYARRGLKFGPISFMPSDLYKIASIIFLSRFLILNKKYEGQWVNGLLRTGIIIVVPTLLVMLQPDLSTSLAILMALGILYLIGGFKMKFWIPVLIFGAIAIFLFLKTGSPYQLDRVRGYLDPEKYASTISWHIIHSLYAVSRGGLTGTGYGRSVLKYGYLADEVYNDMIFAVIAEEFGFIGSVLFIMAIFLLFYLIFREAMKSKDTFAKYMLVGIGSIYLIQSLINVGVSINLIPNTGITLPFISYGGTSMVIYFIMIGMVLNVSRHNNKNLNKIENKKKQNRRKYRKITS